LKDLGGKEETCVDIVLFQAGILHQDLLHGAALRKESQDILRSEPGATDDGFAYHYFGINVRTDRVYPCFTASSECHSCNGPCLEAGVGFPCLDLGESGGGKDRKTESSIASVTVPN
jgi:hypothetical protein